VDLIKSDFTHWPNKCGFNKVINIGQINEDLVKSYFIIGLINVDLIKSDFNYLPNKCRFNKVIFYYWSNK
jgi:hypothetical protein